MFFPLGFVGPAKVVARLEVVPAIEIDFHIFLHGVTPLPAARPVAHAIVDLAIRDHGAGVFVFVVGARIPNVAGLVPDRLLDGTFLREEVVEAVFINVVGGLKTEKLVTIGDKLNVDALKKVGDMLKKASAPKE